MDKEAKENSEIKAPAQDTTKPAGDTVVTETKHSNNKVLVIVLVVIGVLVVMGVAGSLLIGKVFQKAGESLVENATNSTITIDETGKSTITNEDTITSAISTEKKLPTDFPNGIPLYVGQKITGSSKVKNNNDTFWAVTAEVNDTVAETAEKLKTLYADWESDGEQQYNDSYYQYYMKGNLKVNLYIFKTEEKTNVQYSVTEMSSMTTEQ